MATGDPVVDRIDLPPPKDKPPKPGPGRTRKRRGPGRPPGGGSPAARPPGVTFAQLETGLNEIVGLAGMVVYARDEQCGGVILSDGPTLAKALTELARQDPRVKKALLALVATSGWSAVILATFTIAIKIGSHHGLPIPPGLAAAFNRGAVADVPPNLEVVSG